jgi:tRNA threonylcarbamoyladenosine biosynthesis protein TsaB
MLVLAIDTSTLQGAIGWVKLKPNDIAGSVEAFAECSAPAKPGHAETLLHRVAQILSYGGYEARDVELLVFGKGPGTFTGLRIGLSTVKGLGLADNIPVIGMSSLEALAFSVNMTGVVAPLIDARRSELYGALYETVMSDGWPRTKRILDEQVGSFEGIIDTLGSPDLPSPIVFTGNGVGPYRRQIAERFGSRAIVLPKTHWAPSPFWMARIGYGRFLEAGSDDIDTIVPVYLREPDARLPDDKLRKL